MDLKLQFTRCDKKRPVDMSAKFMRFKKWLNMNSKPDKECEIRDEIALLSEILANSICWQSVS
jgi:hypothetical protein